MMKFATLLTCNFVDLYCNYVALFCNFMHFLRRAPLFCSAYLHGCPPYNTARYPFLPYLFVVPPYLSKTSSCDKQYAASLAAPYYNCAYAEWLSRHVH